MSEEPKEDRRTSRGITPNEEARLRANGARMRRELYTTQTMSDRQALAASYRKEHGLLPPTPDQLRAAGVRLPLAPDTTGPRRRIRDQRGSVAGTLFVLLIILVFLFFVYLYITNSVTSFFGGLATFTHGWVLLFVR